MKAKANLFRTLVVLPVVLVGVAVALFGVGLRTAETQTTTPKMQVRDLGTLGGTSSYGTGINDSGNVVGYSDTSAGEQHAFLYDSTNGMKDLNDMLPADSSWTITSASAINSDGKIAASGYGNTPPDPSICPGQDFVLYGSAFVLTLATTATPATYEVQDLGTLGSYYSRATGISDTGQVVGYSYTGPCYGYKHAFLYDENATPKMQDLGTLGIYDSVARGINDFGQVVGQADDPEYWELFGQCGNDACQRAFLYDESATPKMQNLGTLLGDIIPMAVYGSGAWDINNSGQVVGVSASQIRTEAPHGFLYDASAATPKMEDLNTLIPADSGWTITSASAINNDGKIAATGYKEGVGTHALLLTLPSDIPPPEDIEAPSPPTIIGLVGHQDTYDSDGSFTVYGTAEGGSTVELFEGTTSKGTYKSPNPCSGVWSIDLSGLSEGTHTYTAKATDAAGNTSSASDSVTVTVGKPAPTVSSTSPANNTSGVAVTANVTATFSEDMDPNTLTTGTFTLTKQGSSIPVAAHVTYDATNKKAILDPDSTLEASTSYTATIKGGSTGVKDLAGNALAQDYTWTFTTATPQSPSCTITGTANAETISGTSADDVICVGGGSDTVKGLGGNDTLKGEGGNDTLLGGVGNDTLDGGTGTDTASYSASLSAVTASLATNSSTGEGSDSFIGVENLLGSSNADSLSGSAANNKLTGGGGPDTEQGGSGSDQVIGSGGADTLKGEDGDDAVNSKDGVNGNDSLDGGGGTDTKVTDTTEKSIVGFP